MDIAVHVHLYYLYLAAEIRSYLDNIPVDFYLYITTDTSEKAALIESIFEGMKHLLVMKIVITDNHGRDIAPMLLALGPQLAAHDLVLHIHTKRSPQCPGISGWRRYLLTSLLGNPDRVLSILHCFMRDIKLGILFPIHFYPIRNLILMINTTNDVWVEKLLVRMGKSKTAIKHIDRTFFPSGDMFWFRGKILLPILKLNLSYDDFEPELGQFDETLAHAMERMFPYFAHEIGFETRSFLAENYLSEHNHALPICEFEKMPLEKFNGAPIVLFENNDIWQSNLESQPYIIEVTEKGGVVLRVFYFNKYWFVQWIIKDDRALFYTRSQTQLFAILEPLQRR